MRSVAAVPGWALKSSTGTIIRIFVQPNAKVSAIIGEYLSGRTVCLKVQAAAVPLDGAANDEVRQILKKAMNISLSRIVIVKGETSRNKEVLLKACSLEETVEALLRCCVKSPGSS